MRPAIYEFSLSRLADPVAVDLRDQAKILRVLFVNQGFYNLFVAAAGVAGLVFVRRGQAAVGTALIVYMCLFAAGAGIVLAVTTIGYIVALLQTVPAAIAAASILRSQSNATAG